MITAELACLTFKRNGHCDKSETIVQTDLIDRGVLVLNATKLGALLTDPLSLVK